MQNGSRFHQAYEMMPIFNMYFNWSKRKSYFGAVSQVIMYANGGKTPEKMANEMITEITRLKISKKVAQKSSLRSEANLKA